MTLPRILFPVDLSERSRGAARYAAALSRHFQSELTLLHVMELPAYMLGAMELAGIVESELAKSREALLETQLSDFAAEAFQKLAVRRLIHSGDPAHRIVEFAQAEDARLIVMPTHGCGTFRRAILGSVTAKVLHDAECPVLTGVHLPETGRQESPDFRRILCALDLGPQSAKALGWAWQFAAAFGAHLTAMHVTPAFEAHGELNAEWQMRLTEQAREKLAAIQASAGAQSDILVTSDDDTPKAVGAYAARLPADLLVIGRGSASGASGRLRANAYAIIRQSPCPVVSV